MSQSKYKHSTFSGLIDSEGEESFVSAMPTPDSAAENAPVKKGRGRPKGAQVKAAKVTKAPARRLSGRLNKTMTQPGAKSGKRAALTDRTNNQNASDTEEVDDFEQDIVMDDEDLEDSIALSIKPTKAKNPVPARKQKSAKVVVGAASKSTSVNNPPFGPTGNERITTTGRSTKQKAVVQLSPEKFVAETQQAEIDMDEEEQVDETVTKSARNTAHSRSHSRPRQASQVRRRAGSASDTERSDPAMRRKLGELTKKYDALNVKYQDMREIGLKEGERNFERLKKQSDEKTRISNELLSSLKADVAHQTTLAKESKSLKRKLELQSTEMAALQARFTQLSISLAESQAENKTLSAKLAANRTAASSVESAHSKVPGSAIKANGGIRMMGTAETALAVQAAQLKEDIYSDLTGLIIQGVKREAEEDVFNCLQTGRNGTLHFKLATTNDKASESYEDATCTYVPQLDPSRDQSLIELLPDYLVEQISFPRPHAARFYARVVKALTEKLTE